MRGTKKVTIPGDDTKETKTLLVDAGTESEAREMFAGHPRYQGWAINSIRPVMEYTSIYEVGGTN